MADDVKHKNSTPDEESKDDPRQKNSNPLYNQYVPNLGLIHRYQNDTEGVSIVGEVPSDYWENLVSASLAPTLISGGHTTIRLGILDKDVATFESELADLRQEVREKSLALQAEK